GFGAGYTVAIRDRVAAPAATPAAPAASAPTPGVQETTVPVAPALQPAPQPVSPKLPAEPAISPKLTASPAAKADPPSAAPVFAGKPPARSTTSSARARRERAQVTQKPSGVGVLVVESRPPSATVLVDGRPVGTTPMSLSDVPAGTHAVRLERDGYRFW